jgi:hypothetical protein
MNYQAHPGISNFVGAKTHFVKLLAVKLLFSAYSFGEMEAYMMQRRAIYELAIRSQNSEDFLNQLKKLFSTKRRGRPCLRIVEGGKSARRAAVTVLPGNDRHPHH